jgi:hypothetical protein
MAATILEEEIARRILGKVFDRGRSQASPRETGAPPHTGKEGLVVRGRSARFLFLTREPHARKEGLILFPFLTEPAAREGRFA